jgi:hypothetical protein
MKRVFILTAMVLLIDSIFATQHNGSTDVISLKNIRAVRVVTAICCGDAKQFGPSEDRIRAAVESHLRFNGIRLLSKTDIVPGDPTLYVEVTSFRNSTIMLFDCYSAVSLDQDIVLVRDPKIRIRTSTWSKVVIGTSAVDKLKSDQESRVDTLVGLFLKAWRAANP